MNQDGELYMLEINPNCDVAYPLDEAGSADLDPAFTSVGAS
jgi:hypothetical protein